MWLALKRPWLKRVLIVASVLIVLVGLYAIVGFLVVPHVLRSELTSYVNSNYHRRIALGDIRFNPFTLTLDVRDLGLPDADGTPMVGAGLLHVEFSGAGIWHRAASFRDILIERPFAHVVVRPDGTLNLAALETPAAAAQPRAHPASSGVLRLIVDRFTLRQGRATYDDHTAERAFHTELTPINFELRNFSTIASAADAYALDLTTTLGERFQWSGNIGVAPAASRGRFEITALHASTLAKFLGNALPPIEFPSGLIGVQGDYELSVSPSTNLRVAVSRLTVADFGVRPRNSPADYVDLSKVEVDNSTFDLAQHALTIGPIHLNGGTIRVWRTPAGGLNFADLMVQAQAGTPTATAASPTAPPPVAAPSAAPASPGAQPPAGPAAAATPPAPVAWSLAAPDISVAGLNIEAEDQAVMPAVAVKLADVTVHVGGYHSPGSPPLDLSMSAAVNGAGKISASGTYALGSGATKMHLQLAHVDLSVLQPYVAERSAVRLTSGLLGTKLDVARSAEGALTVSGDIDVAKLRTVDDRLRRDLVKWDRLNIVGLSYRSAPARLAIRSIVARGPYALVIVTSDRKLNITEALAPGARPAEGEASSATAATAQPASTHPASTHPASTTSSARSAQSSPQSAEDRGSQGSAFSFPVSIGKIQITNGSAHYTDLWIEPHFSLAIQSLNGSVSGMSSNPHSRAKIQLDGKVDEYAPIQISGEVNLLSAVAYTDMKMSFKGVELTSATPYSAHFAGYKIEKGKISADINYHIENGSLRADHHIVIDQLQLGEKVDSKDAVHLPLKLAIALLKDRNGVIDLGLPVTGSLSDPKFKLGPLIWKVVVNVLEKAATAPFALLGKLFGGGEQMKYIDFAPGSADLDKSDRDRLASIGKVLLERPGLELDVPSAYAPSLDGPALSRAMLNEKLAELSSQQPAVDKHGHRAVVEEPVAAKQPAAEQPSAAEPADAEPAAPSFTDPTQHFRLLLAAYRSELGKDAPLPPEAAAVAAVKKPKKGAAAPPLDPAIGALESALLERMKVSNDTLDSLGRHRSRAIRDALLGAGQIAPQRLFVLNTAPTKAEGQRVRLELSLK